MKLNITAELNGKEVSDQLLNDIKTNHGIVINEGAYDVKCLVFSDKAGKEIEVDLDKVRFVFNRK